MRKIQGLAIWIAIQRKLIVMLETTNIEYAKAMTNNSSALCQTFVFPNEYSHLTLAGTFTANSSHSTTVQAPANTGSVWYKYMQTIKITTNATCAPFGATSKSYTLTNCRPASVLVKQCCTSLGGTLSFTGNQTGDRSVTLSWGGLTNTSGIDHYVISYGTGPTYKQIEVAANRTSIEIGNLTNGRTYHFEIQAIGKTGSPSYCNSNTATVNLSPVCN